MNKKEIPKSKNFLTNNYKPTDIELIKGDLDLKLEGYQIYYLVDSYEVVSYLMPFTRKGFFEEKNLEKNKDESIAYQDVLGSGANANQPIKLTNLFLPNEYKLELLDFRENIEAEIKEHISKLEEKIKRVEEENFGEHANNESFLDNFDSLIYIMILADRKNNSYNRFKDFFENKITVFRFANENKDVEEYINDIFQDARVTQFSHELYSAYLRENNIENTTYKFLERLYNDITVIDRLFYVNRRIQEEQKHKIYFLYLSSPHRADKIFKCIKGMNIHEPKLNKFNLHRNIFQIFLFSQIYDIINNKNSNNEDNPTKLEYLTGYLIDLLKNKRKVLQINNEPNYIFNAFAALTDKIENSIENSLIVDAYNEVKELFKNSNTKSDKTSESIKTLIKRADELKKNISNKSEIASALGNNIQSYSLSLFYAEHREFYLSESKDVIKFIFQTFPTLLFLNHEFSFSFKDYLYDLFDNITTPKIKDSPHGKTILDYFHKVVEDISSKTEDTSTSSSIDTFLTLSFLELITISSEIQSGLNEKEREQKEKDILEELQKRKFLIESTSLYRKKDSNHEIYSDIRLRIQEIDYFILWIKRRLNHSDCVEHGEECVALYKDDPRFLQGLGLAFIANVYDKIKTEENCTEEELEFVIDKLNLALKYLNEANKKYIDLWSEEKNDKIKKLIIKNTIAVINSINDINLRLVHLNKKFINPTDSDVRHNITFLKKDLFLKIKEKYESFATLVHTEAELEYSESLSFENLGNVEKAIDRIEKAAVRITQFIAHQKEYKDVLHLVFESLPVKIDDQLYKLTGKHIPTL